mmetsp:Transcript_13128/g.27176  ORF Transcript_13128/g.27176 Transcript_13128/m.27176 type:complete len:108 (+) Transcript_13128:430-753(+)
MGWSFVSDVLSSSTYSSLEAAKAPCGRPTTTVEVATSAAIPPTFPSQSRRDDEATAGFDTDGSIAEKASAGFVAPNNAQHRRKALVVVLARVMVMSYISIFYQIARS